MPHCSKSHVKLIYSHSKAGEWFLPSHNHCCYVIIVTIYCLVDRLSDNLHYINKYETSVTVLSDSPVIETSPDLQHVRTCRLTYCNHLTWPHVWMWIIWEKWEKKLFGWQRQMIWKTSLQATLIKCRVSHYLDVLSSIALFFTVGIFTYFEKVPQQHIWSQCQVSA